MTSGSGTGKRAVIIALDSITPVMVNHYLAEGRMPNLDLLRRRGWTSEVVPTWPATTPAGWTTAVTGAWPSTHGVEGFAVHVEGEALDKKNHACLSDRVKAETLWQAAERSGRRSILLKFPLSWPPTAGEAVLQVDGAGGWGGLKCLFDLVHSGCWDTEAGGGAAVAEEAAVDQDWVTRDSDNLSDERVNLLQAGPPGRWEGLPPGLTPLWETVVELRHRGRSAKTPVYLLAAATATGETGVLAAPSRTAPASRLTALGRWTDWVAVQIETPAGPRAGHVRFRVMALDIDRRRLRLYQSQVHQADGFARPPEVAAALVEAVGPFVEWTESYDRLQGWIDDETQMEIYEQHVEWMTGATRYLLKHHPWDLFFTELHFLDMAYHLYWGLAVPGHPGYDPARAPRYRDLLGQAHRLADDYLGAVREAAGDEALMVVLGDHGHDLYHTSLLVNHLLIRDGLLALYQDRRTGRPRIDWRRTRAYASSYRVYVNLTGRDPEGIVAGHEYADIQERIIEALYQVIDPRTGRHPVRLALRREDAESFGLYGGSMGDVVYAMAPGYQTRATITLDPASWAGGRVQTDRVPVLRLTEPFKDFTGEHDSALPLTRSIRTLLYLDGPTVCPGSRRVPVRLVDVAPTICLHLGLPYPAHCEGGPIPETFRGVSG